MSSRGQLIMASHMLGIYYIQTERNELVDMPHIPSVLSHPLLVSGTD